MGPGMSQSLHFKGDKINTLRRKAHIVDGAMGVLMFVFAGQARTGAL